MASTETLNCAFDNSGMRLHRNVMSNVLSTAWSIAIGFLVVPLYIKVIGIEGYGLVGFYISLAAIGRLLDGGLSPAFSRELARAQDPSNIANRDLLRTLETIIWLVAVVVAVGIILSARPISAHWVRAGSANIEIGRAVAIMGAMLALQFPLTLYTSGLIGLERQVLTSILSSIWATARAIGALLVLWFLSPTITAYFAWQVIVMLGAVILTAWVLRRQPCFHGARKPRFSWHLLRSVRRLAIGLGGISVLSVLVTQTDKLILARLLPLRSYGYYMLAAAVASSLYIAIVPVQTGIYPQLVKLVKCGDEQGLVRAYHHGSQLLTVLLIPAAAVIACFSADILRIWTGNQQLVSNAAAVLTLLAMGTALNGLTVLPFELQVAHGWTRLHFNMHLVILAILVPSTIIVTPRFGPLGAAANWVGVNLLFVTIEVFLMHRRVLARELRAWCTKDVLLPSTGAVVLVLAAKAAMPINSNRIAGTLALLTIWIGALLVAAAFTAMGREWMTKTTAEIRRIVMTFFLGRRSACS